MSRNLRALLHVPICACVALCLEASLSIFLKTGRETMNLMREHRPGYGDEFSA